MIHAAILVSGDGKYTRRLLDSVFFHEIANLKIVGMVASAPNAQALTRARNLHVPTFVVEQKLFPNEASYGVAVLNKLRDIDTDFVIVDGANTVPACVTKHFAGRMLQVKLTPVGQTMEITIYLAGVQAAVGQTLAEAVVALEDGDTQESFSRRVYAMAESLVTDAVDSYCAD